MNFGYSPYSQNDKALSVSDANRYIKMLIDNDALLSAISISGEISNLKYHTSGHLYFTLKDEDAEISAVMFRSAVNTLRFSAKNGMKVTAFGRISVYEKSGKYQMYVSAMTDSGKGELQLEYERLYKKLAEEGIFDKERKRPIPKIPECIGIITSPTGAALRDMINVTGRRWPAAKILICPSLVQGEEAPASLCQAIERLNAYGECDVIIIGRGGGSIEDLWAFNDEGVVRAVAASAVPMISAVGHETDFTLCDFAADMRAPTPSAAAEIAVPDRCELKLRLDDVFGGIEKDLGRCIQGKAARLSYLSNQLEALSPSSRLRAEKRELDLKARLIQMGMDEMLKKNQHTLAALVGKLDAMNPLAVLGRGYSVAKKSDGSVVSSVRSVKKDDMLSLVVSDGEIDVRVTSE